MCGHGTIYDEKALLWAFSICTVSGHEKYVWKEEQDERKLKRPGKADWVSVP